MALIKNAAEIESAGGIKVNREFIQSRNCTVKQSREVSYIVIHYTGNRSDSAAANARYFSENSVSASAHYFVDEESIYQSVALKDAAWHCGTSGKYYHSLCRNANSIGIEMCCSQNYTVSEKTIENAVHITARLCELLGITPDEVEKCILRHYDITHKSCPRQWAETNSAEFTDFKNRVKNILKGDEELMSREYDELKSEIEKLKSNAEKVYHYGTALPEWGAATVQKLMNKGFFTGATADDLNLPESMLRIMVINDRAGLYD